MRDEYDEIFYRVNEAGLADLLHVSDGSPVTWEPEGCNAVRIQTWDELNEAGDDYIQKTEIVPVYGEQPNGIQITVEEAKRLGLETD